MSEYKQLKAIFHGNQEGEKAAKKALDQRLAGPSTLVWDFQVGPHSLFVVITALVAEKLEQVWRNELDIAPKWAQLPPAARAHYLTGLLINEIQSSNSIEGIHSTRQEIREALNAPKTTAQKRFREMASLYASLLGSEESRPPFPQTPADIRDLYDELLKDEIADEDAPDGTLFRGARVLIHDGQRTVHAAPAGEEEVNQRMMSFLEAQECANHKLINALMGHFMFEFTHPFYDGNGRLGRFLLAFALTDILSTPTAMSLSHQFSRQRHKYYKAFEQVENQLNYAEGTFFLLTMLGMLIDAQRDLEASLTTKQSALESLALTLRALEHDEYESKILYVLGQAQLFGPEAPVSLKDLADYIERSWNTARPVAERLEEQGLIIAASRRPLQYSLSAKGLSHLGMPQPSSTGSATES